MIWLKLISFLLVPIMIVGLLWLGKDDMEQRSALAVANAGTVAAEKATKAAQDSETGATNLAQAACSKQAVISLQGGRTIERIVQAPVPEGGRGMVTSSDLRTVIGQ